MTRTCEGIGTIEAADLVMTTSYVVTRAETHAGPRERSGMGGGQSHRVDASTWDEVTAIYLEALTEAQSQKIFQALSAGTSVVLNLEGGSKIPISWIGGKHAHSGGNETWSPEERCK